MRRRETSLFLALAVLFLFAGSAQAYRPVIDLGTLGGSGSRAWSINDNGQIVGEAGGHACLFDPTGGGANKSLGGADSYAWSINNNGQIVGSAYNLYGNVRACLFDSTGGGANTYLGRTDVPWRAGAAYSINNNGRIVGQDGSTSHAYLFGPAGGGNDKDLGSLGGSHSRAYSINDNNQIVGYAWIAIGDHRACLFDSTGNGANINLGTLGGYPQSDARSINDNNQIVGYAYKDIFQGGYRACLFDPTGGGANKDLKTLGSGDSLAYSINDNGQIVGQANGLACLFDPTGGGNNIDLNTFINPASGWTLQYAYSINNNGWIVGEGINAAGQTHAYLLIPEPTCAVLMIVGATVLISHRRKR